MPHTNFYTNFLPYALKTTICNKSAFANLSHILREEKSSNEKEHHSNQIKREQNQELCFVVHLHANGPEEGHAKNSKDEEQ